MFATDGTTWVNIARITRANDITDRETPTLQVILAGDELHVLYFTGELRERIIEAMRENMLRLTWERDAYEAICEMADRGKS